MCAITYTHRLNLGSITADRSSTSASVRNIIFSGFGTVGRCPIGMGDALIIRSSTARSRIDASTSGNLTMRQMTRAGYSA